MSSAERGTDYDAMHARQPTPRTANAQDPQ
jgi:hypothetical protein